MHSWVMPGQSAESLIGSPRGYPVSSGVDSEVKAEEQIAGRGRARGGALATTTNAHPQAQDAL